MGVGGGARLALAPHFKVSPLPDNLEIFFFFLKLIIDTEIFQSMKSLFKDTFSLSTCSLHEGK